MSNEGQPEAEASWRPAESLHPELVKVGPKNRRGTGRTKLTGQMKAVPVGCATSVDDSKVALGSGSSNRNLVCRGDNVAVLRRSKRFRRNESSSFVHCMYRQ